MGVAKAFSRIVTVVSMYVLPSFIADHGISATMAAGALISAAGLIVSVIMAPETKGRSLAETAAPDFNGR